MKHVASAQAQPVRPMGRVVWWVFFAAATVTLSWCFHMFKVFTLTPVWQNGLLLIGCISLLALTLMVLVYDSYVKEKAKGTLEHPIRLFEWVYALQSEKVSQGGSHSS